MGVIKKLDSQLTNMIAAGEVVERPQGIIKELIENAIDAKSKNIQITIRNGGLDMLEVADDGIGMDADDIMMAFERHATSKIAKQNDLWNIHTLGFRGEALPSIASVSRVELTSNDGSGANRVVIKNGEVLEQTVCEGNQGTTIVVSELFYQTPARLKHLKSGAYEASLINEVVVKFALANPGIAFTLVSDNKTSISTSGNGNLLEVIFKIYGKDVAKNAYEIDAQDYDYHITGYLIHPQYNRANKYQINVFMNNRMVRSYKITKQIIDSYRDYMSDDRYPIVIMNIGMDSKLLDVNVHPSKWEVRISKEVQLEQLIRSSCEQTLKVNMNPYTIAISEPKVVKEEPVVEVVKLFESLDEPLVNDRLGEEVKIAEEVVEYNASEPVSSQSVVDVKEEVVVAKRAFPSMRIIGQMHGKFILAENEKGLYIIDQHAAQERVHYEEIINKLDSSASVDLLVPVMLKVTSDVVDNIGELNKSVSDLNVEYEAFASDCLVVRRVPVWMQEVDEQRLLMDLIDYFKQDYKASRAKIQKHKIATMACHRSIRFNRILTMEEMVQVVDELKACEQPFECPHGRPTFVLIEDKLMEREFLR